ncbi:MAG: glycoside hydrolase family 17 protein [Gammaproteobacteria bacterium]
MIAISRMLFCCLFIVLVHFGIACLNNRPQAVGLDVPSGKLMSLSYAPFREGYSPLQEIFPPEEYIAEDLRLLADKTQNIRTYSSGEGAIEKTPYLARKYGIGMIQGCWLGHEDGVANKKEVEALIQSANANGDVVKRVIVGNEVLLRGDMDVEHLIDYIRQVKRAVKQPVSYADVWSMYMKHPELIKEVDFITIHILPYWEDEPISVENAPEHLEQIVQQVEDEARSIAQGKPILIGESGWPSAGRQRGQAVPSVVNEARYIREMIQVVNRHGFDYNIVEAFNQPWKSELEGIVGANWGLFSANRTAVFPLTGPVMENPNWKTHFTVATGLWMLMMIFFSATLKSFPMSRLIVFAVFAQIFCVFLVNLADFLWYTSYSLPQRAYTVIIVSLNALLAVLLLKHYASGLNNMSTNSRVLQWLGKAYLAFVLLALYKTWGLAVNGRYLSFPIEQFTVPVFGIIGFIICQWLIHGKRSIALLGADHLLGKTSAQRFNRIIAAALVLAVIGMIFGETLAFMDGRDLIQAHTDFSEQVNFALEYTLCNQQLLEWLFCLSVLSIPFWLGAEPPKG